MRIERSQSRIHRIVASMLIVSLLALGFPVGAHAQQQTEGFSRQVLSNIAGAFMAAGALYLVSLTRPKSALASEPPRLDFGDIPVGKQSTVVLSLLNKSKDAVVVDALTVPEGFTVDPSALQLPRAVQPKERVEIPVTFKPAAASKANAQLVVRTHTERKKKEQELSINLKGDARGQR